MTKLKVETDAFFDGNMAYNDGKDASTNPFEADSVQGVAWLAGWTAAYDFDNSVPSEFDYE